MHINLRGKWGVVIVMNSIKPTRKDLLTTPVEDYRISTEMTVCDLIKCFSKSYGFMAGHVAEASRLLAEMWLDKEATRILAFTANLVATGLRGVIAQLVREGFPHIIITTCGTLDHDIARGTGHHYYRGSFNVDDTMLRDLNIHRLGNIFIPYEDYGIAVESFVRKLVDEVLTKKSEWSPHEIIYEVGLRINDEDSILYNASRRRIPVIVPGITDGAFGTNLVMQARLRGFKINIIGDEMLLADTIFKSKRLGALIIGGGISKHHTIWWAQFKEGLDYAIYITTAVEYDGSLSGAQPREAISWGKIKTSGRHVVVYGDATILLPLIVAGAKCIIEGRINIE